ADGTATGSTINDGGTQYVLAGGTANNTTINNGLMQNADGEDTGTTVKNGGVYELGRNNSYYYGQSAASDLTVEAGGWATVYAGTLTGATVTGENATLMLMRQQTGTDLSLTGNVTVTDHARLVAQRDADMSGADLSLRSEGALILTGDADCPEKGCSWSVNSLAPANGDVVFYDTAVTPVSDGRYQTLTTGSLSGSGSFYMHTNVASGQGDRLVVTGTAEGNHRVYVQDTGVSPTAGTGLTLVTTG
ncbi:TPA: autotransporter outer membrane beta-barrel domain-containing protein, partial [Escherichia coli]|nr:autotransporter outer membrane beta-barrel domain-containing protein [Escherichia coli]